MARFSLHFLQPFLAVRLDGMSQALDPGFQLSPGVERERSILQRLDHVGGELDHACQVHQEGWDLLLQRQPGLIPLAVNQSVDRKISDGRPAQPEQRRQACDSQADGQSQTEEADRQVERELLPPADIEAVPGKGHADLVRLGSDWNCGVWVGGG